MTKTPVDPLSKPAQKRLREAALKLFAERGAEVSLSDLAQAAGVARGTIYNNSGSTSEVFAQVADQLVLDMHHRVVKSSGRDVDPVHHLANGIRFFARPGGAPDKTVARLKAAGVYSLTTPRVYGGLQTDLTTWMEVITEIGRGDGGVARGTGLVNSCNMFAACFPQAWDDRTLHEYRTVRPAAERHGLPRVAGVSDVLRLRQAAVAA